MRLSRILLTVALVIGFAQGVVAPARAQSAVPGCDRYPVVLTTTRVLTGPSIAADPLLRAAGIAANGVVAFFPDTVRITETANYQGVEGLSLVVIHSFVRGTLSFYRIPDWLLAAYRGDIDQIRADIEQGLLVDRGPCP
jgi:hypothetical protein